MIPAVLILVAIVILLGVRFAWEKERPETPAEWFGMGGMTAVALGMAALCVIEAWGRI